MKTGTICRFLGRNPKLSVNVFFSPERSQSHLSLGEIHKKSTQSTHARVDSTQSTHARVDSTQSTHASVDLMQPQAQLVTQQPVTGRLGGGGGPTLFQNPGSSGLTVQEESGGVLYDHVLPLYRCSTADVENNLRQ